jgi:hypothetical protein
MLWHACVHVFFQVDRQKTYRKARLEVDRANYALKRALAAVRPSSQTPTFRLIRMFLCSEPLRITLKKKQNP